MQIRKAVITDAEKIAKNNVLLAKESENINLSFETVFLAVKSIISDEIKGFYIVAEENNKIIGQTIITFEWSDWRNTTIWWIQSVYVQKQMRNKKFFSKIFECIKKQAKKENIQLLRLYVHKENNQAKKIYKKIGLKKQPYEIFQYKNLI